MNDEEYVDLIGVRVVLRNLPGNIKAFSAPHGNGYAVVINDALGPLEQRKALAHEVQHIRHGDHHNEQYDEYA